MELLSSQKRLLASFRARALPPFKGVRRVIRQIAVVFPALATEPAEFALRCGGAWVPAGAHLERSGFEEVLKVHRAICVKQNALDGRVSHPWLSCVCCL